MFLNLFSISNVEYAALAVDTQLTMQRVTKRCRLSWLANSALVYVLKYGGRRGVAESQPMSAAVHRSPKKLWRSNSIFNLRTDGITCRLFSPASSFLVDSEL